MQQGSGIISDRQDYSSNHIILAICAVGSRSDDIHDPAPPMFGHVYSVYRAASILQEEATKQSQTWQSPAKDLQTSIG